ncbi:MAG TPA: SDR family NAD(P)-dependent oxidoreductase [Myxococcales bacterium]|nr:SDR family NAD(P)-dependent oxidoreductase [Myxococcales bacterium]
MHVVVTGASSGIGRAIALEYGRAGAKLTLVARRRDKLEALARELGTDCFVAPCDLSDLSHAADWLEAAEQANGPIDVLVNNAGVMTLGATAQLPAADGQRMLDVCLGAPLHLTRAVLPGMLARGGGAIVQVSSMAAFAAPPGGTWYSAAKAGLEAFTEGLRAELRGTGVHLLGVYPGPVATPLADAGYAAYEPNGVVSALPLGSPERLAQLIRRGVERRQRTLVYPGAFRVGQIFPRFGRWFTNAVSPKLKTLPTGSATAAMLPPAP